MNKIRFNHEPHDKQAKRIRKDNLRNEILFAQFLFIILITVSLIRFCNSFYFMDQSNIDKKEENKDNSNNEKPDDPSNIEIQTIVNVQRLLTDTQINTWTINDQIYPKVTSLSDGNFVVVWQSYLENGSGCWNIYGQIFYSNGKKMGTQFPVSDKVTFDQTNPNVSASSNGIFMVVWIQNYQNIFGRMFKNDGTKVGNQFQINTDIGLYANPSMTALKNNNFVVAWDDSSNIYAQIFTDNGNKVGIKLNIASGSYSSITSLFNGNFVVSYLCSLRICAQIFYSDGTTQGTSFQANTYNFHDRISSISSISTSNFMIVWESYNQDHIGNPDWGIYGQSFTNSGVTIGNEFRVVTHIISDQVTPSIASLANDNYIVTWEDYGQDGDGYGIFGQILDSVGNKIGNEFKVNTITTSNQYFPSVASLVNTDYVVVWMSYGQDGYGFGVFGNLFQKDGTIVGFNQCPLNCQSCDYKANCDTCNPNFELLQSKLCACLNGFYLDISGYICTSKFNLLSIFKVSY